MAIVLSQRRARTISVSTNSRFRICGLPAVRLVTCPAAMSDGAAILLSKHLSVSSNSASAGQDQVVLQRVLQEAYNRLVSFDPDYAWTSGQWMTERPGGSDVSRTETLARLGTTDDLAADKAASAMQRLMVLACRWVRISSMASSGSAAPRMRIWLFSSRRRRRA